MRLTQRKTIAIPMDQALEKEYNKVAKGGGGIIVITRREKAVAQWNLLKHEKVQYLRFLQLCDIDENGEYNLHHEFSKSKAESDEKRIGQIPSFILDGQNPFDVKSTKLRNLVTGKQMDAPLANYLQLFE